MTKQGLGSTVPTPDRLDDAVVLENNSKLIIGNLKTRATSASRLKVLVNGANKRVCKDRKKSTPHTSKTKLSRKKIEMKLAAVTN